MASPGWTAPQPASPTPAQFDVVSFVLCTIAAIWIAVVVIVMQIGAWFYSQTQLIDGVPVPGWFWVVIAVVQALFTGAPALALAAFGGAPRARAAARTWFWAIAFGLLLSLARLCPVTWTQPAAVVQIVLSLLATFFISKLSIENEEVRNDQSTKRFSTLYSPFSILSLALGMLIILSWLRNGALGSPTDTLLNLLAALSLGLFASVLLDRLLLAPLLAHPAKAWQDIGAGGVAAGVALLVMGAGFGYGGSQILLMIMLLPLGGAALAIGRWARVAGLGRAWPPIAGVVAAVAAGPLLLLDPDEFFVAILDVEVGLAFRAAFTSFLIALIIGLALWAFGSRLSRTPQRSLALGVFAASWLVGALIYFFAGQPGFYGEQLFIILREQADLSRAAQIADRGERLRFVYTTLTQHADRTQSNLRATLDRLGVEYRSYYLLNSIEVKAGPLLRAYLAARPEVDRILDSPHLRPVPVPIEPEVGDQPPPDGPQWNVIAIGAERVWDELGATGQGIVVGESDSGVQGDHPALRDAYRGRGGHDDYNWLDPWFDSHAPTDVGGHGTHTTGSILGRGGIGVAPGAQWIGCVNLGRNLANPAYYLDCMQFMLAPYPQSGDPFKDGDPARAAHVLNNSWGCPPIEGCDAEVLNSAVRALRAAGIFVVASAGNEGPRCESVADPIAIYDAAFSVGAIDRSGNLASFSSRGPVTVDASDRIKPDIVAPGVDVLSALPGGTYGENSGTSMAGPQVVGVVALMWSAQPKLIGNIDRTEQLLQETARPYEGARSDCSDASTPNTATGYGVVDAYAAVKAALAEP